eukprot:CAMPEP_0170451622 /NCGR_PEP_ID=MMETSP0123-20130129/797_1 /TAXON_ID=182087 /ORGANISM="Favella ehrenbergii, Strain Fehren 1" /LENGTH=74 /DNA_ID=CAMNT_0010713365 /DNA_START=887 /DNA_END=1111 /DNA_ORIENTATION=+
MKAYPKILLIDDEPINIEVIKAMLEMHNYTSDIANSGRQALSLVKERHELFKQNLASMYSLVLLDYSMPDMDGP